MLDDFSVKLPAGFPDHPHRGFETVTYMRQGSVCHEDFKGNKGTISPGDCQWMTAGKGIVHAEMPASAEEYSLGFQLWINLAAKDKLCDPQYQEIKKETIPVVSKDNVTVKVIAGESLGVKGPIYARTPAIFLDVHLDKNAKFEQIVPKNWNGFAYLYEGKATFDQDKKINADTYTCIVFEANEGELVRIETQDNSAKLVLIAGQPLKEKVVQYGPFVMTKESDIYKTFEDFETGTNGFESAPGWESDIKDLAHKH